MSDLSQYHNNHPFSADDDVYYYICWRRKFEGETENMGVCTKERKGVTAEVLTATPCTNSLGGENGGNRHEGCGGRSACWKFAAVSWAALALSIQVFVFFFRFETVGICRKEWEMPKENDAFMVSSAHESRQKLEIGANDSACVPFRRLRA